MSERETHSFGMVCKTHGVAKIHRCSCGQNHGTTHVKCGIWCPMYEAPYIVDGEPRGVTS